MDLQTEYTQRHDLKTIVPAPDTYLLFSVDNIVHVIFITHCPRTNSRCENCWSGSLAIEIAKINSSGVNFIHHSHLAANENIISKIQEYWPRSKINIIRFTGDKDLEKIIWQALGQPGKNLYEELLMELKNNLNLGNVFSKIITLITFRKQPLLYDVLKDI